MTTQNNGLPRYPHMQKHIASGYIHVQMKFSNKLVNHIPWKPNSFTQTLKHITYILLKVKTLPLKTKFCILIKKFLLSILINFFIYIFFFSFFHLLPPWGVTQAQGLVGLTPGPALVAMIEKFYSLHEETL
jgi:hypothetical protein